MTEYALDVSKWRCGGYDKFQMGEGETLMENDKGFSCCLGQFAKQMGVDLNDSNCYRSPRDVAVNLGYSYDDNFCTKKRVCTGTNLYSNTFLAQSLMYINDETSTTPREKVSQIRELLEKHGHTLKVLNEEMLDEGYRD